MAFENGAQVAAVRRLLGLSQPALAQLIGAGTRGVVDIELCNQRRKDFSAIDALFASVGVIVCTDEKNVVLVVPRSAGIAARAVLSKKIQIARAEALAAKQKARGAIRAEVLQMFELFRGERSDRQALDAFIKGGLPASLAGVDGKPLRLSRRTLEAWLGAWRRQGDGGLVPKWHGGRKAFYDKFPAVRAAFMELLERTPKRSQAVMVAELRMRFADGAVDRNGRLCRFELSETSFGRAVRALRAQP